MKVLYPKCAGLDVHKDSVVAAFRDATGKEVKHEVRAIGAVMASQLQSAYYMLLRRQSYKDLGADHFEAREKPKIVARLVRRLKQLGVNLDLGQLKQLGTDMVIKPSGDRPAPAPT